MTGVQTCALPIYLYPTQIADPLEALIAQQHAAASRPVGDPLGDWMARQQARAVPPSASSGADNRAPRGVGSVSLSGSSESSATAPTVVAAPSVSSPSASADARASNEALAERFIVVALDPGHGGEDPGAVGARGTREKDVVLQIAKKLKADEKLASRAAEIAKTDLLTDMVGEFPELQGIMGTYYAKHDGENADVASACSEHYMPRFAGDSLPQTQTGTILAIADKLETLVGIWGVGLAPTGDKDPYALRRHALGICRLLLEKNLSLSLPELIELARTQFTQKDVQDKAKTADIYEFIIDRLRAYLRDQSVAGKPFTSAEIEAALSQSPEQINDVIERLTALREFNALPQAAQLAAANKRISNILKKTTTAIPASCSSKLLQIPAEIYLHQALNTVIPTLNAAYEKRQYVEL